MASATDVIAYIGIPLAVLGVLPIFYIFFLSILTQRRIHFLLLYHGHKPLTSTGFCRFPSLSNRSLSRRSDGTGFVIRSSSMTSQVEVELPVFTIASLEHSSELYWKLDAGSVEHGHDHQSVARGENSLSMIEKGRVRGVSARRKLAHVSLEETRCGTETVPYPVRKPQKSWSRS